MGIRKLGKRFVLNYSHNMILGNGAAAELDDDFVIKRQLEDYVASQIGSKSHLSIYTDDSTLTANRTVTMDGKTLSFDEDVLISGLTVGKGGGSIASNTTLGNTALPANTTGFLNTSIGAGSMLSNTLGWQNIAIGPNAMANNLSGNNNTVIGVNAGANLVGSTNVFLGHSSGFYETGSSKLFIDNATRSNEADARVKALIYGVFSSSIAGQTLTINGSLKVNDGTQSNGYVLTCDANGLGSWQAAGGGSGIYGGSGSLTGATVVTMGGNSLSFDEDILINGLTVGRGSGSVSGNTTLGANAFAANTTGNNNIAIGVNSFLSNTQGDSNVAIGPAALTNNTTGDYNVAIGQSTGSVGSASGRICIGFSAGNYGATDNELFIDNTARASGASNRADSIVYGLMDATRANQRFTVNAHVGVNGPATSTSVLSVTGLPTSSAGLATGDVYSNSGVLTIV